MQRIVFIVFLFTTFFNGSAQEITEPPYKKFSSFPPVKLLLPDSTNWFQKSDLPRKKPVMLLLFNPKCEHCQHEAEELVKNAEKIKNIHVVMVTTASFDEMLAFRAKYGLAAVNNITVARDTGFFLPVFFDIHNLPFHAFYNRKQELISVFAGSMSIEKSMAELDK